MVAPRPLLLLTRPEHASLAFWNDLPEISRASVDLLINPLLSIHVTGPLPTITGVNRLIFTSANALDAYRKLGGKVTDIPVIAVGENTGAVAKEMGFDVDVAGGNADRLVQHILDVGYHGPLIHLKGEQSIGDVARRLTAAGVTTRETVLYEQRLEGFKGETMAALSQDRPTIAPVFSPRTARQLGNESGETGNMSFAAISNAVADALPPDAASRTWVSKEPTRDGMVALVADMIADAVTHTRPASEM